MGTRELGRGDAMKNPCTCASKGDNRSTQRKAKQGQKDVLKVTCRPSSEATASRWHDRQEQS